MTIKAYHLVDTDDKLLHTEGEGEQGVLTGLAVGGDTSLELTSAGSDDKHGAVSLKNVKTKFSIRNILTWEVPVIMFLMKSRCPGASMMVT
jgi:hypothetical protein